MTTVADKDAIRSITVHHIDGAFVDSHGQEVPFLSLEEAHS